MELIKGGARGRSRIVTSSAKVTLLTRDTITDVSVKEDFSTRVVTVRGLAKVSAKGKSVRIAAGYGTEVLPNLPPSSPVRLPPEDRFALAPKEIRDMDFSNLGTAERGSAKGVDIDAGGVGVGRLKGLKVGKAPGVDVSNVPNVDALPGQISSSSIGIGEAVQEYHIQLALDVEFTKIVYERDYSFLEKFNLSRDMRRSGVRPGVYWGRLAEVDLLGFRNPYSKPRKVRVKSR